ncbi:U32 family peptidase, partial [Virgibacillus sp.]
MRILKKKPEVLAPAGTLEKLKTAIYYGADAVYIGGSAYGLRSRAGNFSYEEMQEGVAFAKKHEAHVYVAANMVAHEGDMKGAGDFFRTIRDIGVRAVIVSDPALIETCMMEAPGLPIHLSTQSSATNYETLNFWKQEGLERVVLAREVGMDEIKEIRNHTDVEIEAFIHGAMCISYSGRCTLSNHMSARDANRGGCSQSCRWKYDLFELDHQGVRQSYSAEETDEPFSMSAVDMSMIHNIPDFIENGVDSLKIEGRMKSIHYVSTVANVYRKAVDSYCEDPAHFTFQQAWEDELWKVAQRELSTGFYYGTPNEQQQLFGRRRKIPVYKFVGQVLEYNDSSKIATVQQRNSFSVGDKVEFYGPGFTH